MTEEIDYKPGRGVWEQTSFLLAVNSYQFDDNGNLLNSNVLTNTFDAANRLVETSRSSTTLEPIYNGVNDRVGQVTDGVTTTFALDGQGLPEVIYTSEVQNPNFRFSPIAAINSVRGRR